VTASLLWTPCNLYKWLHMCVVIRVVYMQEPDSVWLGQSLWSLRPPLPAAGPFQLRQTQNTDAQEWLEPSLWWDVSDSSDSFLGCFLFYWHFSYSQICTIFYLHVDTAMCIRIIFLSYSRRWAYLSKWRQVPLNGVDVLLYRYVDVRYLADTSYHSKSN